MPTAVQAAAKALYDLLGLYGCNCASPTLPALTSAFQGAWLASGGGAGVKANGRFDPATRYALATTLSLGSSSVPDACYSPQNDGSGPCDRPAPPIPLPFPHPLPLPLPLPVHLPQAPPPTPPMAPAPQPVGLPAPPYVPPVGATPPATPPSAPPVVPVLLAGLLGLAVGFGAVYVARAAGPLR